LVTMGVAAGGEDGQVDLDGLAEDLGKILGSMRGGNSGSDSTSANGEEGATSAASSAASSVSSPSSSLGSGVGLVSDVIAAAERHGLMLPKAFGLLAKQALYFDR